MHPASAWLASESGHIEHESGEHDLHAFQAIRRMDEILVANFMVFDEVVEAGDYDLVIGDEAWDVDYFLHENPELKRFSFAWMTDFVGWLPMPDGGPAEAALTADYNAEMIEQRARFAPGAGPVGVRRRPRRHRATRPSAPACPTIRAWTEQNFDFAGYVTGFDAAGRGGAGRASGTGSASARRAAVRGHASAGPASASRCCVGCWTPFRWPGAGARICGSWWSPVRGSTRTRCPRPTAPPCVGYLPDLHRRLAAADIAVVQGGLTTCMELTACRTPFVYVPLRHHFEQNFHVRHRLDRYGAGRYLAYEEAADPDALAEAISNELARPVDLPAGGDRRRGPGRAGCWPSLF